MNASERTYAPTTPRTASSEISGRCSARIRAARTPAGVVIMCSATFRELLWCARKRAARSANGSSVGIVARSSVGRSVPFAFGGGRGRCGDVRRLFICVPSAAFRGSRGKRRAKSLRIGVHHANAIVWGPVYRRTFDRSIRSDRRRRARGRAVDRRDATRRDETRGGGDSRGTGVRARVAE